MKTMGQDAVVPTGNGRTGSIGRRVLLPASMIYARIVGLRNWLYDRGVLKTQWVPAPVISVGNITTGGTGKTPMVIYLARKLQGWGYSPGVILRGYGAHGGELSDEERLLRQSLAAVPVIADPDRWAAARRALAQSADVLIADDGYQHRRLGRDMNICLIDATCPFGGEAMLPAGRLREPISSLSRADVIIITRCEQLTDDSLKRLADRLRCGAGEVPVLFSRHEPTGLIGFSADEYGLDYLSGKSVYAFAGIARPEAFYSTLESLGAKVSGVMNFADHHVYGSADLARLAEAARRAGAEMLVCTAKDAVKLDSDKLSTAGLDPSKVAALGIRIVFCDEDEQILSAAVREMIVNFNPQALKEACGYVPADK